MKRLIAVFIVLLVIVSGLFFWSNKDERACILTFGTWDADWNESCKEVEMCEGGQCGIIYVTKPGSADKCKLVFSCRR